LKIYINQIKKKEKEINNALKIINKNCSKLTINNESNILMKNIKTILYFTYS